MSLKEEVDSLADALAQASIPDKIEGTTSKNLELFEFDKETKSRNIRDAVGPHVSGAFYRVKWLNDTHAVLIFDSEEIAAKALASYCALPESERPLTGGIRYYLEPLPDRQPPPVDSPIGRRYVSPAKRMPTIATTQPVIHKNPFAFLDESGEVVVPSSPSPASPASPSGSRPGTPEVRPQKTDQVARRMIANALGVKVERTPEQRAYDRTILEQARRRKEEDRKKKKQPVLDEDGWEIA
ncbi:hypothetical protein SAICODRAFT_31974 [Saitoella complicata NRRL Y-17804]|uniref:Uncharacterized protein n=1 Tax=Saitoella complicata (strain BCRC 22490 / CBS 7301 / JCM 7358 / NBRC 10748 / NRRL Y-17804) TaxID=698492 RepID=A0A0E9N9Z4_SAICN|nr:uncharacterized protein SAICODRAFT_31974 [Saitoella complicata NRRL Y-17804]ODQ50442.1 hypothetical protein SAICODRAFT_31974 [Saitoella complicata NRRL Y-17804]GAO46649.1 hypothetical protein G7K_0875-t1 [Saitoella complicata NRRL Y-17804]